MTQAARLFERRFDHMSTPFLQATTMSGATHSSEIDSPAMLAADNPFVPQIELEFLLAAVLPPVPEKDCVCKELLARRQIELVDNSYRWQDLLTDPAASQVTFNAWSRIFVQVVTAAKATAAIDVDTLVSCTVDGSIAPESAYGNPSRPDGYIHLSDLTYPGQDQVNCVDIVLPMVFKKACNGETQIDVGFSSLVNDVTPDLDSLVRPELPERGVPHAQHHAKGPSPQICFRPHHRRHHCQVVVHRSLRYPRVSAVRYEQGEVLYLVYANHTDWPLQQWKTLVHIVLAMAAAS